MSKLYDLLQSVIAKVKANEKSLKSVPKTVNGAVPDANGNVEIEVPEGFSGSWNDLTEKPFGENGNPKLEEVYNQSLYFQDQSFDDRDDAYQYDTTDWLVEGEEYVVSWEGNEWTVTCYVQESGKYGDGALCVGDIDYLEYPFFIGNYGYFRTNDTTTTFRQVIVHHIVREKKQLDEKYIPATIARKSDIPESFSGNWNDLKNRPFGELGNSKRVEVYNQSIYFQDPSYDDRSDAYKYDTTDWLIEGEEYVVTWEGDERYATCYVQEAGKYGAGTLCIGDIEYDRYPFFIGNTGYFRTNDTTSKYRQVIVHQIVYEETQLDEKYIPDTIARKTDVQTMIDSALGVIENGSY